MKASPEALLALIVLALALWSGLQISMSDQERLEESRPAARPSDPYEYDDHRSGCPECEPGDLE